MDETPGRRLDCLTLRQSAPSLSHPRAPDEDARRKKKRTERISSTHCHRSAKRSGTRRNCRRTTPRRCSANNPLCSRPRHSSILNPPRSAESWCRQMRNEKAHETRQLAENRCGGIEKCGGRGGGRVLTGHSVASDWATRRDDDSCTILSSRCTHYTLSLGEEMRKRARSKHPKA